MGLKKSASAIYLNVFEGKLARRHKTPNADTVTRTTAEQTIVHEEYFKTLSGMLVGLGTKSHDQYGDSLLVYLKSDNETYCLQLSMNSRYATNFLKTLPNVNPDVELEISPSEKTVDGKKDQTIFLRQDGNPVKRYYTKDNPNGMPEPEKKIKKKKEVWDFDAVNEFLEENVIVPYMKLLKNKGAHIIEPGIDDIIPDNSDLNA